MLLLSALNRHKGKALLAFLAMAGLAVAAGILLPRKYASEAKLFVRVGRESVALDPTVTSNQVMQLNEGREMEINSIVEILKGRAILDQVVQKVGAESILGTSYSSPAMLHEKAIEKLEKSCWADSPRRSTVVGVHAESSTPELAQKITQAMIDSYLEEHVRLHRTQGTLDFFVAQTKEAEGRATRAKAELRDAKNKVGLSSLEGQRTLLQAQLGGVQQQLLGAEAALAASEAKARELRAKMEAQPERVVDDEVTGIPNPARDGMRQKLQELQIKEQELAAKYTDAHPLLVAVRQQLQEAAKVVAVEPNERTQTTGKLNRVRESLELALRTEEAMAVGLTRQVGELGTQREKSLVALRELNAAEGRISELEREVLLAEANYKTYVEKQEQARINLALDSERISNVNVVQPPTLVVEPVFPRPMLLLVLGALAAFSAALGVAMLAEFLDRRLHTQRDAEQQLDLPVLVSIPRLASREPAIHN